MNKTIAKIVANVAARERLRITELLQADADKWVSENKDADQVAFLQQRLAHQLALINGEFE